MCACKSRVNLQVEQIGMNPPKKTPLSQDLANILSRVNMEHEPPYKKFRSRSEETFYTINALDLDDYDEELPEHGKPSFLNGTGNDCRQPGTLTNGLLPYDSGERSGFNAENAATQKVGQNQYCENKVGSLLLTDQCALSTGNKENSCSTSDKNPCDTGTGKPEWCNRSDKMKGVGLAHCVYEGEDIIQLSDVSADSTASRSEPQDQTNHTAYKVRNIKQELGLNRTNSADIQDDNRDYTVGSILQDFRRRQEKNNDLTNLPPPQRVYNLDDYEADEFYIEDKLEPVGGGAYPISRCDKVQDLSTGRQALESISELLDKTLETIPEEDSEDLEEHLLSQSGESGATYHSTKVEPRSDCNSLMTTPRAETAASETKLDTAQTVNAVEYDWGQWDNQLNSGYAVSEVLSEVASCVDDDRTTDFAKKSSIESQSSASTMTSSHSNCAVDKNVKTLLKTEVVANKNSSMSGTIEQSSSREKPWYEEDAHDVGNVSASEESYHSVASTPSKLHTKNRHVSAVKPALLDNIDGSVGQRDSTDTLKGENLKSDSTVSDSNSVKVSQVPLTGMAKVFDWETADLNSEIAESVVLSDFVSDVETESRFGSSVSSHPNAAIEALKSLVKDSEQVQEFTSREEGMVKDKLPPSDSVCVSSSSTVRSATSAPGHIETVPFVFHPNSNKDTRAPVDCQTDAHPQENHTEKGFPEMSPSSVKYDLFNPGYSSSQFSIGNEGKNVETDSCMPDKDFGNLSTNGIEIIPRIYVSDGFSSVSGNSLSGKQDLNMRDGSSKQTTNDQKTTEKFNKGHNPISQNEIQNNTSGSSSAIGHANVCEGESINDRKFDKFEDSEVSNEAPLLPDNQVNAWKQRDNDRCDQLTDCATLLKENIDRGTPAEKHSSSRQSNSLATLSNSCKLEPRGRNDLEGRVNITQTFGASHAVKSDSEAFSNYAHLTENKLGTMDLAHSKTNSFHARHISTSINGSSRENDSTAKSQFPVNGTGVCVNNKGMDEGPKVAEKTDDTNDVIRRDTSASSKCIQQKSLSVLPSSRPNESSPVDSDLQLNNGNNTHKDFTFTVDRTESQVIKIQHTKTFRPGSSPDRDHFQTGIKGNKFLNTHKTISDVSMIGNSSYPFYGVEDTIKGHPPANTGIVHNDQTSGDIENKTDSAKVQSGEGSYSVEAVTSSDPPNEQRSVAFKAVTSHNTQKEQRSVAFKSVISSITPNERRSVAFEAVTSTNAPNEQGSVAYKTVTSKNPPNEQGSVAYTTVTSKNPPNEQGSTAFKTVSRHNTSHNTTHIAGSLTDHHEAELNVTNDQVKTCKKFPKPVMLTETNHAGPDQRAIDETDKGVTKDTLQMKSQLSTLGNTNIAMKQVTPQRNCVGYEKEEKILGKPFGRNHLISMSSMEEGEKFLYDGFHGLNHTYSKGFNNKGKVTGSEFPEQTFAFDSFRTHSQNDSELVHSETTTTQHVLHRPTNSDASNFHDQTTFPKSVPTQKVESLDIPSRQPMHLPTTPDVATNIIVHGSLDNEKQEELKSAHNYENVYVAPYVPKPKTCTAMATSTALARKDFKLSGYHAMGNVSGDSVVSAVASAEATGESPYVAVARATARAATIATASAAKGAAGGDPEGCDDKRDVTIMISTSCTLKDDEQTDIKRTSKDVVEALRGDANVAVYTRIAPNPNAILSTDQYKNQPSPPLRKLKVSIEQPFVENSGKHSSECKTVEISLPRDVSEGQLSQMINDSVNKMIVSQTSAELAEAKHRGSNNNTGQYTVHGSEALAIHRKGRDAERTESNMQNVNLMGDEKGNDTGGSIPSPIHATESIIDGNTCDVETPTGGNECSVRNTTVNKGSSSNIGWEINSFNGSRKDTGKKPQHSTEGHKLLEINNNEAVTHGVVAQVENSGGNELSGAKDTLPTFTPGDLNSLEEETSVYSTESSIVSHTQGYPLTGHVVMDGSNQQHIITQTPLNNNENQSPPTSSQPEPQVYAIPDSRVKINEARRRFLEDYNGKSVLGGKPEKVENDSHKQDEKKKKKKKKKKHKKESTKAPPENPKTGDLGCDSINQLERNRQVMNDPSLSISSGQRDCTSKLHNADPPDRRGLHLETQWDKNNASTRDYHSSGAANPGSCVGNQLTGLNEECGDIEREANHMKRAHSVGTLPKEFFIKGGSRSSLIETDLDTGVCTEKPLVYETDLDQLHHANRSSSVSNINTSPPLPQHNTTAKIFERTQSMTVLSDKKKKDIITNGGSGAHISRVQSYTNTQEPAINSDHINRINKSLNKLHLPDWYNNTGLTASQPVQLENTKRDTSRERSPYRVVSPQGRPQDGGVSAMIVSTKPVVIQHCVSPAMVTTHNKSHVMTGNMYQAVGLPNSKDTTDFQLPSAKWKRESHSFKPIPIKGLHEVGLKAAAEQVRNPAKEAYLKLKSDSQQVQPYSNDVNEHSTGGGLNTFSVNSPPPHNDTEVNTAVLSTDPRMETNHTYVNIHGELPAADEPPPPLPPRRPSRPSSGQSWGSYSPTSPPVSQVSASHHMGYSPTSPPVSQGIANLHAGHSNEIKGPTGQRNLKKDTRSESSSSPDALFDSAYASMYKGYSGDEQDQKNNADQTRPHTSNSGSAQSSNAPSDRVNDFVNKFNANWKSYVPSVPVDNHRMVHNSSSEPQVFDESYKHGQYNKPEESANISRRDTSSKQPTVDRTKVKSWNNDREILSTREPLTSMVSDRNDPFHQVNSSGSKTFKKEPVIDQRMSNGITQSTATNRKSGPKPMPKPVFVPPDPLLERAKASPNRTVADFAGQLDRSFPLMQYPNSPGQRKGYSPDTTLDTSRDMLERDSSVDISKGNTTFEDMLDGLLGIPSLNSSMLDTSRTSVRREMRNPSVSSPSFESPLEKALKVITENCSTTMSHKTPDFDSSLQQSSTASMDLTATKTPILDSSGDTLDATTPALDNSYIVKCRNPKCKKEQDISEARKSYKTCHNCFTYYCSRECRKSHWEKHKKKCVFGRVNSQCKHVIKKVHAENQLNEEVSKVARTGYIQKGRGSVLVTFQSLDKAAQFLRDGFESLDIPLSFISSKEIEESRLFGEQAFELLDLCRTYNPEVKYIIEVVIVTKESAPQPMPELRRDGPVIKKCAKLRLANNQTMNPSKTKRKEKKDIAPTTSDWKWKEDNDTLILTAVPGAEMTENMEERKAREICFTNIQMKLRQRGISLRHQYPEVYKKLCMYVSDKQEFSPITLFPTDAKTGRKFMCLIMPNSEPDTEWKSRPDLMAELGLHSEV